MNGGGSTVAPPVKTTKPTGTNGPKDGGGTMVGKDREPDATIGGGSMPMEVEEDKTVNNSNEHKGTIRAFYNTIYHKGAKTTKPLQGEDRNGGGSSTMMKSLKTTMKKVRKSGKKTGITTTRGAKSRIGREFMKQKQGSDSSQMEIRRFFPRKVGIIGPGSAKIGRIPMGEDQKPL